MVDRSTRSMSQNSIDQTGGPDGSGEVGKITALKQNKNSGYYTGRRKQNGGR